MTDGKLAIRKNLIQALINVSSPPSQAHWGGGWCAWQGWIGINIITDNFFNK